MTHFEKSNTNKQSESHVSEDDLNLEIAINNSAFQVAAKLVSVVALP